MEVEKATVTTLQPATGRGNATWPSNIHNNGIGPLNENSKRAENVSARCDQGQGNHIALFTCQPHGPWSQETALQ